MLTFIEENWFILVALWLVYELTINGTRLRRER